jgi:nucleotide-binding universal stress UspA family protein
MFHQILIALKFSAAGIQAFRTAVRLAVAHDSRLHVFHALDYHLHGCEPPDPRLTAALEEAEREFKTQIHPLARELNRISYAYYPADPALEVCRIARNIHADLIIVGCHQQTLSISTGRIDYVGMTILEKATCPVLLIPYSGP